jgi:hypothetical protein
MSNSTTETETSHAKIDMLHGSIWNKLPRQPQPFWNSCSMPLTLPLWAIFLPEIKRLRSQLSAQTVPLSA